MEPWQLTTTLNANVLVELYILFNPFSASACPPWNSSAAASPQCGRDESNGATIEGPLRRKTMLKEGRKPRVIDWFQPHCCAVQLISWPFRALHLELDVQAVLVWSFNFQWYGEGPPSYWSFQDLTLKPNFRIPVCCRSSFTLFSWFTRISSACDSFI